MTQAKRRGDFAFHGVTAHRHALLAMFGADPDVGRGLIDLYDREYSEQAWPRELEYVRLRTRRDPDGDALIYPDGGRAEALLADLEGTAKRFGLDAMGAEYASDRLHEWCLLRREHGPTIGGPELSLTGGYGYMVATDKRIVTWRPDLELRRTAEERAAAALDAIRSDWEAAGWEFEDTKPMAREHLRWLFLRMRHRWSYAEIARHVGIAADNSKYQDPSKAVQRAVERMGQLTGVTLPRPRRNGNT